MSSLTHPATVVKAGPALGDALLAAGYLPGPPPHLTAFSLAVDHGLCAGLACPGCGHDGMECHPFHRGKSYRCVAVCPACSCEEEV